MSNTILDKDAEEYRAAAHFWQEKYGVMEKQFTATAQKAERLDKRCAELWDWKKEIEDKLTATYLRLAEVNQQVAMDTECIERLRNLAMLLDSKLAEVRRLCAGGLPTSITLRGQPIRPTVNPVLKGVTSLTVSASHLRGSGAQKLS